MYPSGIQFKNRRRVSKVALINDDFIPSAKTSEQSLKISENSPHIWFLRFLIFVCVICSAEKSKISSESSFKIIILFSQSDRLVLDDSTSSVMKLGQLCGHSCFRIWKGWMATQSKIGRRHTWTRARFSLFTKVFSFRTATSSEATFTFTPTMKFLMPISNTLIWEQRGRNNRGLPCRWPSGRVFHRVIINFSRICKPMY